MRPGTTGLLLDVDDTLIDTRTAMVAAGEAAVSRLWPDVDAQVPHATTRDTLGFGKPDARAFVHACGLLRSAAGTTTYVGDDIEVDAIAAGDAGLRGVWLQRGPGDARAAQRARARGIPMVTSLSQVPALLSASSHEDPVGIHRRLPAGGGSRPVDRDLQARQVDAAPLGRASSSERPGPRF